MDENTTPVEASLSWLIKKDRWNGGFVGDQKIIPELKDRKKARRVRRVGIVMTGKTPPPRSHCKIFDKAGEKVVGEVTSGTHSVMLNKGVAMAYLPVKYAKGNVPLEVKIEIRKTLYPAQVCSMPFWPTHFHH
jgi:aminomethyltransferase